MRFGYFDEANKEYIIDRPDTPAPWANYLGSPEYGAIISNNAGGYSFEKSGANGRIIRYIFNNFDQPGRYVYLRDDESKDYWSASWQPVGKNLETYKSAIMVLPTLTSKLSIQESIQRCFIMCLWIRPMRYGR